MSTKTKKDGAACFVLGMMSFGNQTWQSWVGDGDAAERIVAQALDAGICAFDTADAYSDGVSERLLGQALRANGANRGNVEVMTKVGLPVGSDDRGGLRPERIIASAHASLERLGLDHIDLYQMHGWDANVPISETLDALNSLVSDGLISRFGACNWSNAQLTSATSGGDINLSSMQVQFNLAYREDADLRANCAQKDIEVLAYSPLARGRLTPSTDQQDRASSDAKGSRLYPEDSKDLAKLRQLVLLGAKETGMTPAQVALAWVLQNPEVGRLVIGARSALEIQAAISANSQNISDELMKQMDRAYLPRQHARGDLSGSVQ